MAARANLSLAGPPSTGRPTASLVPAPLSAIRTDCAAEPTVRVACDVPAVLALYETVTLQLAPARRTPMQVLSLLRTNPAGMLKVGVSSARPAVPMLVMTTVRRAAGAPIC